ncbi:MAG: stage II sporulation protein P [Clostridiales bacterium]|nr:stage II sporulation protein P [Clostridiales bacterium]
MKRLLLFLLLMLTLPAAAMAEDVYTLLDPNGDPLTFYAGECEPGDEYISSDNQHYRVKTVNHDDHTAAVEHIGQVELPDVSWLEVVDNATPVSASKHLIAIYCTHSDESYIEGDGKQSDEERGGIYDIADEFAARLEDCGATVVVSDQTHLPHDSGAYRRSRSTAVELLKQQPRAVFDLHRDGIPDPDEYAVTIGGKKMSKVRLLVGKSNQNKEANLDFAKHIKAVGDKLYPGLIKDIYMGKGTYNQDLAPRCILLEFGTHTLSKERVMNSTGPMADVAFRALFGGITGSAGASDVRGSSSAGEKPAAESNEGSGAVWWIVGALVLGIFLFGILSTGSLKGGSEKWKRSFSEMTGGLIGKRNRRE